MSGTTTLSPSKPTLAVSVLTALDGIAYSAIIPLIPHLRASLGLTTAQVGVVLSSFSVAVLGFALPSGHLADRFGAKWMAILGGISLLAGSVLFAVASSFVAVVGFRLLAGLGDSLLWTAGVAWAVDGEPTNKRGRSIGVIQAAGMVGITLGPIFGGVVAGTVGLRTTFLGIAVLVGCVLAWSAALPRGGRSHVRTRLRSSLRLSISDSVLSASMVVLFLVAIVGGALQLLIPLHLAEAGMSEGGIGWIYTAGALAGSAVAIFAGWLGNAIGWMRMAVTGTCGLGLATIALATPQSSASFASLAVATLALQALLYAVGFPMATDRAQQVDIGSGLVLGALNLAWSVGAILGPICAGRLLAATGSAAPYIYLGCFALVAAALVQARGRTSCTVGPAAR
jgi:DHA1 family bicyclomycin/chloramphenicol resistance-like MFS transporter